VNVFLFKVEENKVEENTTFYNLKTEQGRESRPVTFWRHFWETYETLKTESDQTQTFATKEEILKEAKRLHILSVLKINDFDVLIEFALKSKNYC
jgi:hypothetical protein